MSRNTNKSSKFIKYIGIIIFVLMLFIGLNNNNFDIVNDNEIINNSSINSEDIVYDYFEENRQGSESVEIENNNISQIEDYNGKIAVQINNNIPYFTEAEHTTEAFEKYSDLDSLGRCGVAYANLCKDIMPKDGEERESISSVKPTGWIQKKYNGKYLYNRCHLIGYQLSAENANKENLVTGTSYFNVSGMLPFENKVAEYINENKNSVHVLYRVTPHFKGNNLLANGVQIEAYSVEDKGKGICFNVYVYNVQPGVSIDYSTGASNN